MKAMAWLTGAYFVMYGGMWVFGKILDSLKRH
jgi:hypothetical protein